MKKTIRLIINLVGFWLVLPLTFASWVRTSVNVSNASVYVKQKVGNESFEMEIENGSGYFSLNTTESGTKVSNFSNSTFETIKEGEKEKNEFINFYDVLIEWFNNLLKWIGVGK